MCYILTIPFGEKPKDIPPTLNKIPKSTRGRNGVKKKWEDRVKKVVEAARREGILPLNPISKSVIFFRYYFPTKRRRDTTNVSYSIKAFEDALVETGVLEDDSYKHLQPIPKIAGIDKKNPRVEIIIQPVSELPDIEELVRKQTMKLELVCYDPCHWNCR